MGDHVAMALLAMVFEMFLRGRVYDGYTVEARSMIVNTLQSSSGKSEVDRGKLYCQVMAD